MKILCATDLLPRCESAMDRAGMLAEQLGADLSLLHVVAPTELRGPLELGLQNAGARLKARARAPLWKHGSPPNVRVPAGNPARILIETSIELNAGLVVMGIPGNQSVRDALGGKTAQRALSALKCPVLFVRGAPQENYRHVLLALDSSKASASAVRAAEALVLKDDVRASVVHAYRPLHKSMHASVGFAVDSVSYAEAWKREATAGLRALLEQTSSDVSRYEFNLVGVPTTAVVHNVIDGLKPDLLVLGTHGYGQLQRALAGTVASRILTTTECDVLVVPEGAAIRVPQRERAGMGNHASA